MDRMVESVKAVCAAVKDAKEVMSRASGYRRLVAGNELAAVMRTLETIELAMLHVSSEVIRSGDTSKDQS